MAGAFTAMVAGSASAVLVNSDFEDVSGGEIGLIKGLAIDALAHAGSRNPSCDVYRLIPD